MNCILQLHVKKTQRGTMRKLKVTSGLLQENSFIVIMLNPVSNCTCREKIISCSVEVHRRYQNNMYVFGRIVGKTSWRLLERGWRKRIVRCMDRLHKIHFVERKATWWVHMVWWETYEKTNNLSSRQCMARYVEAYVWCSQKESENMGYRETKARQCQTIERNILHWTKRWRIQAHNQSRSEKVGSSDASSNALQNTDKEHCETHRNIGKRKTKYACLVDADESTRPRLERAGHTLHQDHITEKGMNSMIPYGLIHKFLKHWKFQMQRQQW